MTRALDLWDGINPPGVVVAPSTEPPKPAPKNQIGASYDGEALAAFIRSSSYSGRSEKAVLKEIARWTWFLKKQGISCFRDATIYQVLDFRDWLAMVPAERSEGDVGGPADVVVNGAMNRAWRPFTWGSGQLGDSTIEKTMGIVSAFYTWLAKGQYLSGNPFHLRRGARAKGGLEHGDVDDSAPYLKALPYDAVKLIYEYLDDPGNGLTWRRRVADWWLITLLYWTGHRISALVSLDYNRHILSVGDYRELSIVGKNSITVRQVWTQDLQKGYELYRTALGLPPLPDPSEQAPLFFGHRRRKLKPNYRYDQKNAYDLVQGIGCNAADWAEHHAPGLLEAHHLDKLRTMGPHTLRHTCCSVRLNVLDQRVRDVSDHLGHKNPGTTMRYWHLDRFYSSGTARAVSPETHRDLVFGLADKAVEDGQVAS